MYLLGDSKNQSIQLSETLNYTSEDYQAYGKNTAIQESSFSSAFTYDGEYQDPSTHLLYLMARSYNPNRERFLTMDSYGVWNKYNFADANPINNIDPTGHTSQLLNGVFLTLSVLGSLPSVYDSGAMLFGKQPFKKLATLGNILNIGNTAFTVTKDAGIHVNTALTITNYITSGLGFLHGAYKARQKYIALKQIYERSKQLIGDVREVLSELKPKEPEPQLLNIIAEEDEIKNMGNDDDSSVHSYSSNNYYDMESVLDLTPEEEKAIKDRINY